MIQNDSSDSNNDSRSQKILKNLNNSSDSNITQTIHFFFARLQGLE